MNTAKINIIVYRVVRSIICVFLLLGGIGMLLKASYLKGGIGVIGAIIIAWRLFKSLSMLMVGYLPLK
jgi:hypothetical protein